MMKQILYYDKCLHKNKGSVCFWPTSEIKMSLPKENEDTYEVSSNLHSNKSLLPIWYICVKVFIEGKWCKE